MADINNAITLGIGTPSGITEFLTMGLQIGEESTPYTGKPTITFTISQPSITFTLE